MKDGIQKFLKCHDWVHGEDIPVINFEREDEGWYTKIFSFNKKYDA